MTARHLIAATIVLMACCAAVRAGEWGPWAAGERFPPVPSAADEAPPAGKADVPGDAGPAGLPFIALVEAYRAWLSPVYGGQCRMLPSCSQYGLDAIRKHGALVGIVMTSGRLLHEADERTYAPIRMTGRGYLFFDPVENNDFWLGAK